MFVERPDALLHTLSFGHGPRTLLALGGWIGSGELWYDVASRLGPDWRVIAMDHRGSGATQCRAGRIRLDDLVDDVIAVLDAWQVGCCVVAAESSGAGVALEAVLRAPARFAGMVGCGATWTRPAAGQADGFIAALRAQFDRAIDGFVAQCVPEDGCEAVRHWGRLILRRATAEQAVQLIETRAALTVEDRLDAIRLPMLLLHGTRDAIVPPESSRRLAAAIPGARLVLMEGLGHVPLMTAPQRVADEIRAFAWPAL
jgi:pimeloyl-ACP methyl ester carboxylesterase